MASVNDWLELARSTFHSLESRQVRGLYDVEWHEAKRRLVADHNEAIAKEKSGFNRFFRTVSAVLYGLTKRLTPQRRLLFVAAQVVLIASIFNLSINDGVRFSINAGLLLGFVLITTLLGMELIDKIKFRDELELARELQSQLIPKHLPEMPELEFSAFNYIANTVGGDIYDFIPLADGRVAVLFGDASGHGMAAGLIMAVAHASFRTQLEVDASPGAVIPTLNRILCQTGGSRSFFAGVSLLIDRDGRFECVVAGHPPLLVVGARGEIKRRIGTGSYPLGVKRQYAWQTDSGVLEPGDVLLFHSDGLVESRDELGEEYGDERVLMMTTWCAGRSAFDLVQSLVTHWRAFCGRAVPDDDVSIAAIRRAV